MVSFIDVVVGRRRTWSGLWFLFTTAEINRCVFQLKIRITFLLSLPYQECCHIPLTVPLYRGLLYTINGHSLFFTSRADRLLLRSKENFQVGHCRAGSTFTGPNYRTASHWATGMEPNRKSLRNISGSDCRPSNSDTVAKWKKCLSSCNIYRQQKQTPSCWGIYRNTSIGVLKILIGGFAML